MENQNHPHCQIFLQICLTIDLLFILLQVAEMYNSQQQIKNANDFKDGKKKTEDDDPFY